MYSIYRWLYRQFAFSRGQSNGLLILLPLCFLFVFSEPAWRFIRSGDQSDYANESQYLDSIMLVLYAPRLDTPLERFEFDPNKSSPEDLQRLGFSPKVARRISAYTAKGGRFERPEDLFRIYEADSALVRSILPWVRIHDPRQAPKTWAEKNEKIQSARIQQLQPFDLNQADTTQLKRIRGIGSKLSERIIKYREALGGFYSQNQLYEVFKLDSGVVWELQKVSFVSKGFTPRQMSINSAEQPELAGHPYLTPREAAAIVAYRFTHGKFEAVEDLGKIGGLDSLRLSRVMPYFRVD